MFRNEIFQFQYIIIRSLPLYYSWTFNIILLHLWVKKQTITIFIFYLIIEIFTLMSIITCRLTSNSWRYYYLWKICTWICIILIATLLDCCFASAFVIYVYPIQVTNDWLRSSYVFKAGHLYWMDVLSH